MELKLSLDGGSDEYYETISQISSLLQKHIKPFKSRYPKSDAYQFVGSYCAFIDDFWVKDEAAFALENLSRALKEACTSYEALPKLVKEDLKLSADKLDRERQQKYLENTTADLVFKSSLPNSDSTEAAKALATLAVRHDFIQPVIQMVKKELPEGIQTRNRPGKAWAVIHAAVEVSGHGKRINVPKAIDRSGPFYRLLSDLFELFEVDESVSGAFRGWRKHMDGKYEDHDLMPI